MNVLVGKRPNESINPIAFRRSGAQAKLERRRPHAFSDRQRGTWITLSSCRLVPLIRD
jgi:hypothetical protein